MNRTFTQREKVLLLILAVIVLAVGYMKLFLEPTQAELTLTQDRMEIASSEGMIEEIKLAKMQAMQIELDALSVQDVQQHTVLPVYDNVENVMLQLDAILSTTREYSLQFDPLLFEPELVSRPIHLSFTAANYTAARAVLNDLYHGRYRCFLGSLTVSSDRDLRQDTPVTVDVTVTFYEAYE